MDGKLIWLLIIDNCRMGSVCVEKLTQLSGSRSHSWANVTPSESACPTGFRDKQMLACTAHKLWCL